MVISEVRVYVNVLPKKKKKKVFPHHWVRFPFSLSVSGCKSGGSSPTMHSVEMAGQITEVLLFFVSTCGGLGLRSILTIKF